MEEQVRLICGKLQGNNVLRFWKVEDKAFTPCVGNYAIVENQNSFALIEILGLIITNADKVIGITTQPYEKVKKMVKEIAIGDLIPNQLTVK